jgi:hypothetical protein
MLHVPDRGACGLIIPAAEGITIVIAPTVHRWQAESGQITSASDPC